MATHNFTERADAILKELPLPEGWELYDFGGGWLVAPAVPDTNSGGYLGKHMFAIVKRMRGDYYFLTVEFDLQSAEQQVLVEYQKVLENNKLLIEAINKSGMDTFAGQPIRLEKSTEGVEVTIKLPYFLYKQVQHKLSVPVELSTQEMTQQ